MVKPLIQRRAKPAQACPFCSNEIDGYRVHPHGSECPMVKEVRGKMEKFPAGTDFDFKPIFNRDNTKIIGIDVEIKKIEVKDESQPQTPA